MFITDQIYHRRHRRRRRRRRHHYHHSGCFSLPKEVPLSTCFPQLPVFCNVAPLRSYMLD